MGAQPPLLNKQNVDLVLRHKLRPVNQRCAVFFRILPLENIDDWTQATIHEQTT